MAREQEDREDLLAEATGLVERASLRLPHENTEIVIGFRRDGSVALYLNPDCVYQFTSTGKLRRAYLVPLLYKAVRGQLVSLRREPAAHEVRMVSRSLAEDALPEFLSRMQAAVAPLYTALERDAYTLVGQMPPDADVPGRLRAWLSVHWPLDSVADTPRSK